uniref:GCF C-terminal domain-containing protein n=1 Tax=Maylandia zebra TaxID=106582 RepID=A0A3P9AX40_9CICH
MLQTLAESFRQSKADFSDVQEDFCSVKKILSRFEEWRECYSESYHNAYISLCLPKLLNPIIRHQLLAWNPLKDTSGDFENLPWFTAVETFCHGHGHEELEHTDRQTLSSIIERTVVPKMTAYVELVWDPMSHQQSVCLIDVCHSLKEDYSIFEGEHSKPVKAFTEALVRRLRSCVDEDVFVPLYPKKFLEEASSPQRHFRDQRFWTAVKLLGNMGKWDSLLPESVLKELMPTPCLESRTCWRRSERPGTSPPWICTKVTGKCHWRSLLDHIFKMIKEKKESQILTLLEVSNWRDNRYFVSNQ